MALTIAPARTPEEIDAVRDLCRAFVAGMRADHPERSAAIDAYFAPARWEPRLAELPLIHARPRGDMLLARVDGLPAGCVMWKPLGPAVAEAKRLFVVPGQRRRGTGRALVAAMIDRARADGHAEIRLEVAGFLAEARRLFAACGFVGLPPDPGSGLERRAGNLHLARHL